MKKAFRSLLPVLLACTLPQACSNTPAESNRAGQLRLAELFIDAFYSWDPGRIEQLVIPGDDAKRALYYQGWAEAAHYAVQTRRPCTFAAGSATGVIECRITVTDDFGGTLGYTATDTFTLTVIDNRVTGVAFEGDDPPIFTELQAWIAAERPEVLSGPCNAMFAGGETPAECARAVVSAARAFMAR